MRKISTIYKILIMFMIVFWLENNYITYKTIADVGYSGSVAEKMDKYLDENILNKMTEEQKESLVWDWEEYKITGYPSGYYSKYQDYYDDYINAFNSELLNLGGEGYTSLEKAIVTAKNAGRTKSFDNEQNKALDSGKEVPNVTSSTNSSSSTSTTEGQGSRATTLDDIIKNGKSFLQLGDISVANEDELKSLSDFVSGILLWIAIAVTLISAIIMGINFLTQSVEDKAKIKESMTPWVVGIIVSFGAYTIWQITINLLSNSNL